MTSSNFSRLSHAGKRAAALVSFTAFAAASMGAPAAVRAGDWGVYPDCIAPAVPLEVHGWWWQDGEEFARHLHQAACVPNARTADCSDGTNPILDEPHVFTSRIVTYNNPDEVKWLRHSWRSSHDQRIDIRQRCEQGTPIAEGLEQCIWYEDMTLNPSDGNGGLDELRMTPNISVNEFGKRQFVTLNFQVCTGTDSKRHRRYPDPIGRAWYTDAKYSNVRVNYMDFYDGSLDEVIPTVSGVVTLDIDHQKGTGDTVSLLWQDTNHHKYPREFANPSPVGEVQPHGGVLLYEKQGLFDGTYDWDTRGLANGVHVLYFQTVSTTEEGMSAGALKLLFNVDNADAPPPVALPVDLPVDRPVNTDFMTVRCDAPEGVGLMDMGGTPTSFPYEFRSAAPIFILDPSTPDTLYTVFESTPNAGTTPVSVVPASVVELTSDLVRATAVKGTALWTYSIHPSDGITYFTMTDSAPGVGAYAGALSSTCTISGAALAE